MNCITKTRKKDCCVFGVNINFNLENVDMEEARPIFIDNLKKHKATKLTVTDAELHDWFEKADLNKDGVISVDEAAIFVDKYFLHH